MGTYSLVEQGIVMLMQDLMKNFGYGAQLTVLIQRVAVAVKSFAGPLLCGSTSDSGGVCFETSMWHAAN